MNNLKQSSNYKNSYDLTTTKASFNLLTGKKIKTEN